MSQHDIVLCRSFGDQPLARIVWSITEEGVLITTRENFDVWEKGGPDPVAALAPFDAIYEYDENLFRRLDGAFRNSGDRNAQLEQLWMQAKPYTE